MILAGKEVPLFHRDDEALSWLAQVAHVESSDTGRRQRSVAHVSR